MINSVNEIIDSFFTESFEIDKESFSKIKKKYTPSITDSLDKGHLTTNVCMIDWHA